MVGTGRVSRIPRGHHQHSEQVTRPDCQGRQGRLPGSETLTFTHWLQPRPRAVEQTGALGGAAELVPHLAGEAEEALGLKVVSEPRAVRRGPRVTTESGTVPCGTEHTRQRAVWSRRLDRCCASRGREVTDVRGHGPRPCGILAPCAWDFSTAGTRTLSRAVPRVTKQKQPTKTRLQ